LINARQTDRLPNTSSLTFPGVDADALLLNMPELMSGTGSACTSGAVEPSHVLTAIGLSRAESSSTIRLSLGRFTYRHEIREIVALLFQTSATLRITAQG
jgi:cysteine desulfurase